MYQEEEKNINLLLKSINIPGITSWWVSNLRSMEWEGKIRLDLQVILDTEIYNRQYIKLLSLNSSPEIVKATFTRKVIMCFKHYVSSFLGLEIGDVNKVKYLEYQVITPQSDPIDYTRYDSYDEYEWLI